MLADDAIERYARQIVVPGIGAAGQERLLAATVLVVGDERGCRQAALYLEAAGVRVLRRPPPPGAAPPDLVVVAEAAGLEAAARDALAGLAAPRCWYATDAEGFTVGVHPKAPLPPDHGSRGAGCDGAAPDPLQEALGDVAACDAASVACALLLGLPCREDLVRFDVLSS